MGSFLYGQSGNSGLQVKKSGSGERSIVFIPGLGCSGNVWDRTKQKLKKGYTCYVLTMPGFAGIPARENPSFRGFEKAIAGFILQNQLNKPVLVGHSLGGSLAMAIASDHPDLISKIVVVDALPFLLALHDTLTQPDEAACEQDIAELTTMTDEQFYKLQKRSIWRLVSDTSKQKDVINWAMQSDRRTFAKLYCDLTNTDLRKGLSSVACPSLILLEPYFMDFQPAVEDQFKNLHQKKIEYGSTGVHFIMYDNYDWYMEKLLDFLKN